MIKWGLFAVVLGFIMYGALKDPRFNLASAIDHGQGFTIIAVLDGVNHPKHKERDLHLAFKHQRYSFFWLPLGGSTDGNYVLYQEREKYTSRLDLHYDISISRAKALAETVSISLPEDTPISHFSLYWGWIVIFLSLIHI